MSPQLHPLDRVPPPVLFIGSGLTQYAGAGIAVGLFAVAGPAQVAWLRIVVSAAVLVIWRQPWRHRWTARDLAWTAAFGVALAAMNVAFYIAIDHLPLGTAVAIEFCGPIAVAAITGRGWRERGAIAVAATGVLALVGVTTAQSTGGDTTVGLLAVALAAMCWAAYILLGRRVAMGGSGVTSLGVAMAAGAAVFAPAIAPSAVRVLTTPALAVAILGVAVLSSVIPYGLEQVVLRRVSTATFSVLLALLPATATVIGAVMLHQVPAPLEILGLLLVTGAIAMTAHRTGQET